MFLKVMTGIGFFVLFSCDNSNFFKEFSDKSSDKALLEDAKVAVDQEDYAAALSFVQKMEGDTNEKRVVWASALLGTAGLGVLDIVRSTFSDSQNSNLNNFFDSVDESSVFGSGETRTTRLAALRQAIAVIAGAPVETNAMFNLNCLLSGLLSLPTVTDAIAALSDAQENLETIASQASGARSSSAECPGVDDFEANVTTISTIQSDMAAVLANIDRCPILDLSGASVNTIETAMNRFTENADQGCREAPSCNGVNSSACDALGFGCISSLVSNTDAASNDGEISTCEIVQNCMFSGSCFQL